MLGREAEAETWLARLLFYLVFILGASFNDRTSDVNNGK
jgi:hypothetical protein